MAAVVCGMSVEPEDQPIAKVLAHDKNEDNEHDDDRGRSERKERVDRPAQDVQ